MQVIERSLQLDRLHITLRRRTPVPLQPEAEPRHVVIIFVCPCEEAPARWPSRDTDVLQPSPGTSCVEWGQGLEPGCPGTTSWCRLYADCKSLSHRIGNREVP